MRHHEGSDASPLAFQTGKAPGRKHLNIWTKKLAHNVEGVITKVEATLNEVSKRFTRTFCSPQFLSLCCK